MRVLVTGGAGYIGGVLTEELLGAGHGVVVLDDLSQGHRAAVHPDATFVRGDVCDGDAIERALTAFGAVDAVMHFAGLASAGESLRQPERYLRDNVAGGVGLIAAAARHGVRRFVLASSADVYGAPARVPIIEAEPALPWSPYGESMAALERALGWFERTSRLRFAALRCFSVAGATERCGEDHRPETHLIPQLIQVALGEREHVTIFGDDHPTPDRTCIRDYVHVLDVARAAIAVLPALAQRSRIYNIGTGKGFSDAEVVAAAHRITGRPIPVVAEPRRPSEPAVLLASTALIRAELGWEPRCSDIGRIISSAWAWRRSHPRGYGRAPASAEDRCR